MEDAHKGYILLELPVLGVDGLHHRVGADQANDRGPKHSGIYQHRQPSGNPFSKGHKQQPNRQLNAAVKHADAGNGETIEAAPGIRLFQKCRVEGIGRHAESDQCKDKAEPENRRFDEGDQKGQENVEHQQHRKYV